MGTIVITVAPGFDLWRTSDCSCRACADAFYKAYKGSFDALEADKEHAMRLVRVDSYDGVRQHEAVQDMDEELRERAEQLWQHLHDVTPWKEYQHVARMDDDGAVQEVRTITDPAEIPDGWLFVSPDWQPDQIDDLNEYAFDVWDNTIHPEKL